MIQIYLVAKESVKPLKIEIEMFQMECIIAEAANMIFARNVHKQ